MGAGPRDRSRPRMGRPPARARTWTGATLLAVTALAAVFRLHMLDTVPPGLYLDETLNAQHAIAWRLSAHKAWFEGTPPIPGVWADVPNLYLAGVSGVLRLFGDGFLATRMTSVVRLASARDATREGVE